jgi:hypothetical protein
MSCEAKFIKRASISHWIVGHRAVHCVLLSFEICTLYLYAAMPVSVSVAACAPTTATTPCLQAIHSKEKESRAALRNKNQA